jgi:hypothetical protein
MKIRSICLAALLSGSSLLVPAAVEAGGDLPDDEGYSAGYENEPFASGTPGYAGARGYEAFGGYDAAPLPPYAPFLPYDANWPVVSDDPYGGGTFPGPPVFYAPIPGPGAYGVPAHIDEIAPLPRY